jgi:hypothetical protein
MRRALIVGGLAVVALAACGEGTSHQATLAMPDAATGGGQGGSGGAPGEPGGSGGAVGDGWDPAHPHEMPAPPVNPAAVPDGRATRRLTVDQLRRSIPQLFGGDHWTLTYRGEEVDLFDALARTLGEADYVEVTQNNVDPNPLFQKFMDDMASQLCGKALQADAANRDLESRLILRHPDDVDANLRFLRLKFHGVWMAPGDDAGLAGLRKLHDDVKRDADEQAAWQAVCVALVTSPEFLAY